MELLYAYENVPGFLRIHGRVFALGEFLNIMRIDIDYKDDPLFEPYMVSGHLDRFDEDTIMIRTPYQSYLLIGIEEILQIKKSEVLYFDQQ